VARRTALPALLLAAAAAAGPAAAEPGYYVVTAYDNAGARAIDFRYWSIGIPAKPTLVWPEIGFAYGVSSRWYTEVYASYIGTAASATRLGTVNWQNEYLLTQGELPVDIALHAKVIYHQVRGTGWGLEWGPVLQTDVGRTQLNANVFVERGYGDALPVPAELKYQWQVRHRWKPALHIGLQGFGELGPWDRWAPRDQQSHRAGPAIFGTLPSGSAQPFSWQAAYLLGTVYGGQRARMFSMRLLYGF
jgi:hypothetical protein